MDLFEQRLLAEGLRAIEGDSPTLSASTSFVSEQRQISFEKALLQRALQLDPQLQISALFLHFKRLTTRLFVLLAGVLLLCGASTVQQLFFSGQGTQINFFWAFALFFIPNLLTLSLWLLFFLRPSLLADGWLARFSLFLLKTVEKRCNPQSRQDPHFWPLFKCYFKVSFSGHLGRYQLSAATHLLWFSYFCGASLMLVIMLATHQVDFAWQTSILSVDSFQWLTACLAYIPDLLGVAVPNLEQIQQSHLGVVNLLIDAQNSRFLWSSLLISSLLIYGVLPRCFLWLLMLFLLKQKRKQFSLNLSKPYYVQLRLSLKPNVSSLGVVDHDLVKVTPSAQFSSITASQQLPKSFYPVALELSAIQLDICKKHAQQYAQHVDPVMHIFDFPSQQTLLHELPDINQQAIVLYVALSRVPDRGLLRFIKSLTSLTAKPFYLLLIDDGSACADINTRRSAWYELAEQATISLDSIIHLSTIKEVQ